MLVSSFGLARGHNRHKTNTAPRCHLRYIDFLQTADLVKTSVFVRTLVAEHCFGRLVVASSFVLVAVVVAFAFAPPPAPLLAVDKTAKQKTMWAERTWFYYLKGTQP